MKITVLHSGGEEYRVTVDEGGSQSSHSVTVSEQAHTEFGAGAAVEVLVEESFRFLLEREPKESILSRFELPVIKRYFPEYPEEIRRRMSASS